MKQYLQQVEVRHAAAERVVAALRDALREERSARSRAETQCVAVAKVRNYIIRNRIYRNRLLLGIIIIHKSYVFL